MKLREALLSLWYIHHRSLYVIVFSVPQPHHHSSTCHHIIISWGRPQGSHIHHLHQLGSSSKLPYPSTSTGVVLEVLTYWGHPQGDPHIHHHPPQEALSLKAGYSSSSGQRRVRKMSSQAAKIVSIREAFARNQMRNLYLAVDKLETLMLTNDQK